jgi:(p)ppGpp synthase/HD superfamily hydrolase
MEKAFALANHWHTGHKRKNSEIPYISHLMAVSALVLENGGSPDQASAGLLHDILEDTECSEELLRTTVGDTVTEIVKACTHEPSEDKTLEGWKKRKQHYLDHLPAADRLTDANLVALCDKVHNVECTVRDWHAIKHDQSKMFVGFNAGWDLQLWWYNSLADAFDKLDVPADLRTRFRTAVTTVFGGTQ